MLYRVLILVAKEKLSALDVNEDGMVEAISIEGNERMAYKSVEDIRVFCQYIKEYYNLDDFSDIEMSVLIVKLDALSSDAVCMFEEMKTANECNLVSIEKLLPLLVLKEGLIKPDMKLQVGLFGSEYSIKMNRELKLECEKGGSGQDKVELPIERLSQYFCFDANNLIDNKQELKKCQKEFRDELKRKETAIDKLKKELQTEKDRADTAEANLHRVKEQQEKNAKRYICKFVKRNASRPSGMLVMGALFDDWLKRAEYRIEYVVDNGDVVKKNQKVAVVHAYYGNERISDNDTIITAVENGRIYCLMSSGATIKEGNAVALIGDLSDTKEDIIQWYEKNK